MKTQKEIEKGCGKLYYYKGKDYQDEELCGCTWKDKIHLCPTCQALLQQNKEFIEMIDKQKWDKNIDATTNQMATKIVEYSGGINSVIDRHNKSLELIKSSIIGNKEKK